MRAVRPQRLSSLWLRSNHHDVELKHLNECRLVQRRSEGTIPRIPSTENVQPKYWGVVGHDLPARHW